MNETNVKAIQETSIAMLNAIPIKPMPGICGELGMVSHPFCSSIMFGHPEKKQILNILEDDNLKIYEDMMTDFIKNASISGIFCRVESAYRMTWFKFCCDYMSDKDFASYLRDAWIEQDNPNQDTNVSRKEAIKYFKKADKKYLMNEDDYAYYMQLPDKVAVYRGVSPGREKFGLSWTDDKEKAMWFKQRFERGDKEGYLLKAEIDKKYVLAYINERDEKELIVDVFAVKKLIKKV